MVSTENKDLEIVRFWSSLSQTFGVVAGLFMIAAGFMIITPQEQAKIYLESIDLCERIINSELNNINHSNYNFTSCLEDYKTAFGKNTVKLNKLGSISFALSMIFMFNTFAFWLVGRKKLVNKESKDYRAFWIILIVEIILFSMLIIFIYNRPMI